MPIKRRPPLSAELVRSLFDYDPNSGILRWREQPTKPRKWNTRYAGTVAGSAVKGYLQIQVPKPHNYYAHQIAWCHYYGYWPPDQIDHRDRQRSNNRIENLRMASNSDNGCNRSKHSNNTSGFVGVSFNRQNANWRVRISRNGILVFDGSFATREEAAAARRAFAAKFHGEFANHDLPSGVERGWS